MIDVEKAGEILERARQAAIEYYELTGKPLGITGEVGEYLAAKILGLQLADARAPGYDATDDRGRRIQIKADRKSTRLNSSTNAHLVCRLLLEKKNKQEIQQKTQS